MEADNLPTSASRWANILQQAAASIALLCLVAAVVWSRHWPLFHDAAIMHYVAFLMDHGMRPYRDIVDINMPGAYLNEWSVIHSFGPGPVAWRMFDIATMLLTIVSAVVLAGPQERLGGLVGGAAVCLFHLANGPIETGQRDWSMMVFLLLAAACLHAAIDRGRPVLMFCFAALAFYAASIKPLALAAPILLLLFACTVLRSQQRRLRPYVFAAAIGACVPALIVFCMFYRDQSFLPFFEIASGLTRQYAGVGLTFYYLVRTALGVPLDLLLLLSLYLAFTTRVWTHWRRVTPALLIFLGSFFYLGQRKGWQYHKATLFAGLLLWISVQLFAGLRLSGVARWISAAGVALLCLVLVRWTLPIRSYKYDVPTVKRLQPDLLRLGGPALSGNIQCVETLDGCINTLYNMRLVQSTGFIFDSFLFNGDPIPEISRLRHSFVVQMAQKQPKIIVLMATPTVEGVWSYDRLAVLPGLQQQLQSGYALETSSDAGGSIGLGSYRIYVKK